MEASPGKWLEKALMELCQKTETGLGLDGEIISGLVSYCEMAPPQDAKEYLDNIIGEEAGKSVIEEYLQRRGSPVRAPDSNVKLQVYVKPSSDDRILNVTKKQQKPPKEPTSTSKGGNRPSSNSSEPNNISKGSQGGSRKKKSGKVVSLAEAAKGSIVFQQGKPCSCQARRHRLVSNCLSCGKIVCEQEGEGPCSFCGALVLKEGSQYAGLEESIPILSEAEADAEAFAKRLVEYDRNSAARTTVIDDQSDYYEIESNSWLSTEEKELLIKKRADIEEAERAKKSKVIMTFDLVGRKVLINEDDVSALESEAGILRPPEEKEVNRIKPNPTIKEQPVFIPLDPTTKPTKSKSTTVRLANGLSLEITGRVQHESTDLKVFKPDKHQKSASSSSKNPWPGPQAQDSSPIDDSTECSLDYN
uniref:Activating signal cointegrator 1 n=1 Tax=Kalanchoe fedtschenkoi TaxID=63787 RepID=A0A7N0U9Y9_KALFE